MPRRRRWRRGRDDPRCPLDTPPTIRQIFIRDVRTWHPIDWEHLGDGDYVVRINISAFNGRKFLPSGTWKFFARLSDDSEVGAGWNLNLFEDLESSTRVFLYSNNRNAYTVSFGITDDEFNPLFAMRAYRFARPSRSRPKLWRHPIKRMKATLRRWRSPAQRRKIARRTYEWLIKADRFSRQVRGFFGRPAKPRVLFASVQRGAIEGNLLAVRDQMLKRGLDKRFALRYAFRAPREEGRRTLLHLLPELARADFVLLDDYFNPLAWLPRKPETRYIQLWHAGSGFKSIGYSRFGKFGSPGLSNAHRRYTYAITGSRHLKTTYAEAFGIEETAVVPTGLPRIDAFLDPTSQTASRERVYAAFPMLEGKRVILFAPTFRGKGAKDARYDYGQIDFDALYRLCCDDTIVAFRMHHFVPDPVPIPEQMHDRLIDVSGYREGNELLLVTDLLITDYSSIIYEFSLLERPMLFFAYDEQTYSSVRGFHRPYVQTAPGKVCRTFDELLTAIREEDFEMWRADKFRDENFDNIDTHASDRVIDWLLLGDPPPDAVAPDEEPGGVRS